MAPTLLEEASVRNSPMLSRAITAAACASLVISAGMPAQAATASTSAKPAVPSFVLPDLNDSGGALPLARVGVSATVGDFDADGHSDLIVPNINRAGVVVLLGDGAGGLAAPLFTPLPSGGSVLAAAAGDLNGDAKLDAIAGTIDDTGGAIRVLLGKGDGTFTLGQRINYSSSTLMQVALGDLDGDGDLDIAATVDQPIGDTVEVVINKGGATFGKPIVYAPEFSVPIDDLDLADADGDGDLDLVYLAGCATVRLNGGDGTFGDQICSTGLGGVAQTVADFDGDGVADIAVGDASGGHILVGRGDGNGHFTVTAQYANIGRQVNAIASGDFTGDGVIDLVASADAYFSTPTRVMTLLVGNGDATFVRRSSWATGGDGLTPIDLDEDGHLDVVSAGFDGKAISATRNEGKGTFRAPRVYAAASQGLGTITRTADVNGDGRLDVIAATKDGLVNVFLQKKDGSLQVPPIASAGSGSIQSLALGDVNNDGKVDLVAGSFSSDNIFVMLGKGDGKFAQPKNYNNGSGAAVLGVAVGDVNGDGILDIVSNTPAALSVLLGKGDGTFGPAKLSGAGAGFQVATVLTDVTGDGHVDAVAVIRTGSADNASSLVVVNNGKGDGTFSQSQQISVDTNANAATALVVGKSGEPGLALVGLKGTHTGRTGLYVFANTGGHLSAPTYLAGPGSDLTAADLNADKKVDIATIGPGQLSVFTSSGSGAFALATAFAAGQNAFGIASGDLTGSARTDLVELEDTNPQQITVYENDTSKR